jgi:serine/threonine-protein kinase RsbT
MAANEVFSVAKMDFTRAGDVSARIKRTLKLLGVDARVIRRIAVATYEAEINLVIHSEGGEIILQIEPRDIVITVRDVGPGIADIDQAMTEGFSTASEDARSMGFGAGMGLPNMSRNADRFSIQSKLGVGTTIVMAFDLE